MDALIFRGRYCSNSSTIHVLGKGRGGKPVSENFPRQNNGKTDRMGYNGANYEDQTRPRRRRTESQALE